MRNAPARHMNIRAADSGAGRAYIRWRGGQAYAHSMDSGHSVTITAAAKAGQAAIFAFTGTGGNERGIARHGTFAESPSCGYRDTALPLPSMAWGDVVGLFDDFQ